MVLTVQTPLEISQLQILDKVVDIPVVVQQQVPRSPWGLHSCCSWIGLLTCPLLCNNRCNPVEIARLLFLDRIDDMSVVVQ